MGVIKLLLFTASFACLTACGTMGKDLKNFFSGKASAPTAPIAQSAPKNSEITFSETKNVPVSQDRQYRRMTKKQFEDEELFGDSAGSLWVMEGQDSYLFAENIVRLPGDLLNVVLDGQPEKQLSTKAGVIKDLMDKLEKKKRQLASAPQAAENKDAAKPAEGAEGAPKETAEKSAASAPGAEEPTSADTPFDVKEIPTRIVERMSDGNYRVKGSQTFMIGAKEYKVIVTGMVKPTDVDQNKVISSKMLDSKFDIVQNKRSL